MADDKMKHDDLNKNLGGQQGGQPGQQSPGRHQQDDEELGKRGSGQGAPGNPRHEDDEMGQGGKSGSNPGGQQGGRGGQNR
jgi:hypothetical protein